MGIRTLLGFNVFYEAGGVTEGDAKERPPGRLRSPVTGNCNFSFISKSIIS